MESAFSPGDFLTLIRQKERRIVYTAHAIRQARDRGLIGAEGGIKRLEADLLKEPAIAVEQDSEKPDERKFKLYYGLPEEGGFIAYVITTDGELRVITAYRTSKTLQKKIYKFMKRR
jgi:hypothetical protein